MKDTNMNRRLITFLATGLLVNCVRADDKPALAEGKEKKSYSIGANIGTSLKREEIEIDPETVLKGLKDAYSGKSLMTDDEVRTVLTDLNKEIRTKQQEKRTQQGQKNKEEGEKFLAENKTKPGVITLPSGLQYKILAEGKGESPKSNDEVTVNYRGTLIDGTEFDSSSKTGHPLVRPANLLVKGWTEALQLMKPGAKWQLFLPSELAYGDRGSRQIGPNATLLFDVELISFKSLPPPSPATATPVPIGAQPVTSDIIKVPSKEELAKGAKIEVIKKEDLEKLQKEQQQKPPEKK